MDRQYASIDDEADGVSEDGAGKIPAANDSGAVINDADLRSALEAMLLVVDAPVSTEQLSDAAGVSQERARTILTAIGSELDARASGMVLRSAADGWRLYTRENCAPFVERLLLGGARSKLTRAALETLAVIAYRQPVTRARVSAVRGVNVDGVVRSLLARGLIAEATPDADTGATTFVTTDLFLERLGLSSLSDLPELAPLIPGVDVIDDVSAEVDADPRFARLAADRGEKTTIDVTYDTDDA